MDSFFNILLSILPPFILLGIGGFARKLDWLRSEADTSLSMVTIRILYPCFILFHILDTELTLNKSTVVTPVFGFFSILAGFSIAWVVSKCIGIKEENTRTFLFCSGIFNYGFIAIPVALSLFDESIVVQIILFNLGVEIAIWTFGILVLTSSRLSIRGLLNPPAITVVLGMLLQEAGGKGLLPDFLWEVIKALGMCCIPIGLILIGGNFYQLLKGFRFSSGYKIEISSVLVRNIIFPSLTIGYLMWGYFPENMIWMKEILVVQGAMPAGIFAVVIVSNYMQDKATAMQSIIVTMGFGVISIPFWLFWGLKAL